MSDYERLNQREPGQMQRDPPRWGAIIGAAASAVAVLTVIIGAIWGYAGISYATANIPSIKTLQSLAYKKGRGYASSYSLPTSDTYHFLGDGLYAMGSRRFNAAYKIAKGQA